MAWIIQIKGGSTPWHALGTVTQRNIIGSPVLARVVTTGTGIEIPGVLRYHIISITSGVALVSCRCLNPADSYHPSINLTGVAMTIGGGILQASARVGDEWETGYGYYWDSSLRAWLPVRAFGILVADSTGPSLSIEFTSTFTRPQIYTTFAWYNGTSSTDPQFWSARISGETWTAPGQSPLFLHDSEGVDGCIKPDQSCIVEIRPQPGATVDNSKNPVILTASIASSSI